MDPQRRTYDKHWIPWIKKQLEEKGIKTDVPLMPDPWAPDYQKFKDEFERYSVNKETVLIGHSCGCAFLVRWLGETKQRVTKLILVAPWKLPLDDEEKEEDEFRKAFYNYSIDETIKDRVGKIIYFTSDNEEEAGKRSLEIFHQALGGEIIELPNHGHYTQSDMGTTEFPELLEKVIND